MRPLLCRLISSLFIWVLAGAAEAAPNAPTGLSVTAISSTSVSIAWTDNSSDEVAFLIGQRIPPATGFVGLGTVAANTTSVDIVGLKPSAAYDFVVVAQGAGGTQSAFSNIVSVVTPSSVVSASYAAAYLQKAFSFALASSSPALATQYAASALPPGLSLNAATGVITGTPTAAGKFSGQVTISHQGAAAATSPFTICVFVNPPALQAPAAGLPLADWALAMGSAPTSISLTGLFVDPDVSSAARLTTDLGDVDFAFYPNTAPQTVANFLNYLNGGQFLNTMFHRSVPGFILQGGAFRADATASAVSTQPPVPNEPAISNQRGTVAMAKLGDNPNSATNQFFINLANNASNLDSQNEGFTVFARVAGSGMAVADAIAALPVRNYASINGALTNTPVRGTPPASYDPAALVRTTATSLLAPLKLAVASSNPAVASASLSGSVLTLNSLAPGVSLITITATDLDLLTATSQFQFTVLETFETWAERQAFARPADAAPEADPDRDGRINLAEFAMASPPLALSPEDIQPGLDAFRLTLAFPLRRAFGGTSVLLQSAESPSGPWTTRWTPAEGFAHPWIARWEEFPDRLQVVARDPSPAGFPGENRRFLRLKITRP